MNVEKIRKDFQILDKKCNGQKITYFDNAATSLKPKQVVEAGNKYYDIECANIHRGIHELSQMASEKYEKAHKTVGNFIGSKEEEVIFTKNTTESINLLTYSLINQGFFKKGDKVVVSMLEHHSNIIPWQYLEKKIGIKLEYVSLDENFDLNYEELKEKAKNAKLVSVTGASNTVATQTNLKEIEKIVHEKNALLSIDGAQLIPHKEFNFKKSKADFISFSGHKMLGPTGIGCLIGRKDLLEKMEPFMFGGDMISEVSLHKAKWNKLPSKFEAGTPNIVGAYGINEAINYLNKIGMNEVEEHEKKLVKFALKEMEKIGLDVYGPKDDRHGGITLFDSQLNCHDLATLLNDEGIFIRSGMHCAEPLVSSLNKEGLARASYYIYNTKEEITNFINKLDEILNELS